MADRSTAGGNDFSTVRKVRPGSFVVIGRHKIEVIEGRAKLRITAANGEHVRAGFVTPTSEEQPTSTPTPETT